jgi:23S rRNA (cytosine1962-C5)-methyltransferase
VWPDWEKGWILAEDRDLIVIDKPEGVPTQAADPERPDDVVTRLRAFLAARDGGTAPPYLGVHQRLDRDTSGVLVMTRRREANGPMAAQFEGRAVEKKYVACVVGWRGGKKGGDRITLRDVLVPGDDGRMRAVPRQVRGGVHAVTHVRVLERVGERTLLELTLETGRTHQARVQLAHAGAPIAGDPLYGGAPAPRLMLHARSIGFTRPDGRAVTYDAPVPSDLHEWLAHGERGAAVYDDPVALARTVARASLRRYALGHAVDGPRATTAFRLVNERGDALPGLAVDVYGGHAVAQFYDDEGGTWDDPARRDRVLDALFALGFDGVYLKNRPKQANTLVDTRREEVAPTMPVRGGAADDPLVIVEEGVPYGVRLGDGLSTGISLDQRANRRRVRQLAEGKRVVNLFAYTCAFTVAAAMGGAKRTVSVDASSVAIERGRENVARVGGGGEHAFVVEDAFRWLARAKTKGERYDLVLLDPPSYATTRHTRFVAANDYADLAAAALAILAPGGQLLACINHRGTPRARFRRFLIDAARRVGRPLAQVKDLPDPLDYPFPTGGESHLKSVLVTTR